MRLQQGNTIISIETGDITVQDTEAIVNAANSRLAGGGGVDGAIHSKGGPAIMRELDKIRAEQGGCPAGHAIITTGGNLKAKYVIHTVGPIYSGQAHDAETLAQCYRTSLRLAWDNGLKSVAFPSISTGSYRYPIEEAAPIAIRTVLEELAKYDFAEIRFVLYSTRDYEVYNRVMSQRK